MAKKEKVVYPNPWIWKTKDEIDWKLQGENLKELGGIVGDMLKEVDWAQYGKDRIEDLKADAARVKEEFQAFMAESKEEKIDSILHGEKHLGRLYRKGAMANTRREWLWTGRYAGLY